MWEHPSQPKFPDQQAPRRGAVNVRLVVLLGLLVVLGAVGAYMWVNRTPPREVAPSEVFRRLNEHGFVPEFVCTDPVEFARTVKDRFGTGLGMKEQPPDIEVLGWAYADGYEGRVIGSKTLILMARVRSRPTLVFIDKLREDRALTDPGALMGNWVGGDISAPTSAKGDPASPMGNWVGGDISAPNSMKSEPRSDGRLTLYRKAVGDLVLYELTPYEQPELLGRLEQR